jgi:VanZ family protein
MRYLSLVLLLGYLGLLTFALLSPNPFAITGAHQSFWKRYYLEHLEFAAHFLFFLPLGILACLSDWPLGRPAKLGLLVSYSLASEGLQYFIPRRDASLFDLAQDIAGIAAGAALWWMVHALVVPEEKAKEF